MKRGMKRLSVATVLFAITSLLGCGGGGSSSLVTIPGGSVTVTGTVQGTTIMAVDETGKTAASCVASGTPPALAFTLSLPFGHSYKFFFVTGEGTSSQGTYLLYDGATTTFSFVSGKTYNLGAVTMDANTGKATSANGLVSQSGVTAAGTGSTAPPFVSEAPANLFAVYQNPDLDNLASILANPVQTADTYRLYSSTDNVSYTLLNATPEVRGNVVSFSDIDVPRNTYFRIAPVSGSVEGIRSAAAYLNFSGKNSYPTFSLVSPTEGQTGAGTAPTFVWEPFPGAAAYMLFLHPESTESQRVMVKLNGQSWDFGSSTNVITKYVEDFTSLAPNTSYSVKVAAVDPNGTMVARQAQSGRFTTGPASQGFSQADLTGTWDVMQFKTSTQQQGGGWMRGVVRFDASGHMFIDDNTAFQSTAADDSFPQGDSGWIYSINSAGVVSVTGGPPEMGTFRGNMAPNRQLIVGGLTLSQTDRAIQIIRKRVPGVTYSSADLNNKSVESQVLLAGGAPEWERGNGTIGSDGSLTIANSYDSSGRHDTNIDNAARYSITGDGIVTDALRPTFKGFLTPDKKILIATGTDPRSPSVTNYYLFILTISGQTFAQSDLAGTWNFYDINCGTGAEWAYEILVADTSGNVTLTPIYTSGSGSLTPWTGTLSLDSSGIVTATGDPTVQTVQGVMSYNKDFVFITSTDDTGGVFSLDILMK